MDFITHEKEIVKGPVLQAALNKVADDWAKLGEAIYRENAYANHVPESIKLANREEHYTRSAEIREGHVKSFTIWQRVNQELTGECIALLP